MSISSVLGTIPLVVSFVSFYLISYKVLFQLIPNLFEFTVPIIDYKELGIEIDQNYSISNFNDNKNKFLIKGDSLFKKLVHHVFSFTMALVLLVIELSLFEIEDYLNTDSRLFLWHMIIPVMTMLLVYVIPVLILVILMNRYLPKLNTHINAILLGAIIIIWLYFLSELDVITGIDTKEISGHSIISKYLSELTLLGITLISVLGGIGTISNPFYELVKKNKRVTKYDIDKIVSNLKTTTQILQLRQNEIDKYQEQMSTVNPNNKEMKLLEEEINAILQLKNSIYKDLINSTNVYELQKRHGSLNYKITKFIKKSFSIYCLYRLISLFLIRLPKLVFHKLLHEHDKTKDALAVTISKIIIQLQNSDDIDEDALVNQLSFVLSGSLFLCSMSSVVNTFHSLSRFIPHSIKLSNQNKKQTSVLRSLLISELFGIYTLLTIILLRSNLPDTLSSNFDSAIGGEPLKVKFVQNWSDKISIISCFITIIGISIDEFLNHGDDFDDDYVDEEKFIQNDKFA